VLTQHGLLDYYHIRTCEIWAWAKGIGSISTNATWEGAWPNPVMFVGVLNAHANWHVKRAGLLINRSFKVVVSQMVL